MSETTPPSTSLPTDLQPADALPKETTREAGKRLKRESDVAMAAWLESLPPEERDRLTEASEAIGQDERVFPALSPGTPTPSPRRVRPPNLENFLDPVRVTPNDAEADEITEALKCLRNADRGGYTVPCHLCRRAVPLGQLEIAAKQVFCRECQGEPDEVDSLTPEERAILEMRKSGKTETEIAAEYVSPKTGKKLSQPTVARRLKTAKTKLARRKDDVRRRRAAVGPGE